MSDLKSKIKRTIIKFLSFIYGNRLLHKYKKSSIEVVNCNYFQLDYLKNINLDKFKEIKKFVEKTNLDRLKEKDVINIGFVLYTSSMWSCDKIYRKFEENSRYNPYIIICEMTDGSKNADKTNFFSTIDYFEKKKYKFISLDSQSKVDFDLLGKPDILFYLTPFDIFPKKLNIRYLPMSILTVYIPYSFMVAEREEKFSLPVYYLTWKFFVETLAYKELMREKCITKDENALFCGYTRMDELISSDDNDNSIWKIPNSSNNRVYKIIYAPHHSVFDEKAGFSTFDQNYKFILELAKKYQDSTSWIVKPHPLLRDRITRNGFFSSTLEYDKYLEEWNNLPNAKVVTDGTYFNLFKTSDTMILDSVSFLAEYQYVNKPLLFLTRDTQKFNSFGKQLIDILYKCDGDDFDKIKEYLDKVIFSGNDFMKKDREIFFNKYLNYYKYNNNQLASNYIYNVIEDEINNRREK